MNVCVSVCLFVCPSTCLLCVFTIIEREPRPYSSASSKLSFEPRASEHRHGISSPSRDDLGDVEAGGGTYDDGMGGRRHKRSRAEMMYEDQEWIYTLALGGAGAYETGSAPIMDQQYSVSLTDAQACSDIDMPSSDQEAGRSVSIDHSMTFKIAMFA